MSLSLFGYIEVNSASRAGLESDLFYPTFNVTGVDEQVYEIYGSLFGIGKVENAVAENRGFPKFCSAVVMQELGDMEYISYIHFSEMKPIMDQILAKEEAQYFPGWILILHCMDKLSGMFGEENVRMVVGFC